MARGRRTRRRGTWFPTIGTNLATAENVVSGRAFALTLVNHVIITAISPITIDRPQEGDELSSSIDSLTDVIGSEYVLQRIVGKVFAERISAPDPITVRDENPAILFGAGFFVARANDSAVGGGADTPIGSATEAERRDNYSPIENDTIREPWIWRRTWILGTAGQSTLSQAGTGTIITTTNGTSTHYPASTALYGSVWDGPHIDSKVKRKIGNDDRLWFAVSATPFSLDTELNNTLLISGYLDFRIFGSLRKARNRSAF